jgi:hypothetical protein
MQCVEEHGHADDPVYPAEPQDNGLYRLVCRAGHETVTCVQEQKFEVLFDLALNAVIDGYYREAVASFTSSLERFYEFYIRVLCAKRGLDEATVGGAWKSVANQSERQLGAYLFAYLLENGLVAPQLPKSKVEFRNDVIHKGKIPSRDEALGYGQAVLEMIAPVLAALKKNDGEHVGTVVKQHIFSTHRKIKGQAKVSFMTISTTISAAIARPEHQWNLVDSIARIAERRRRSGW